MKKYSLALAALVFCTLLGLLTVAEWPASFWKGEEKSLIYPPGANPSAAQVANDTARVVSENAEATIKRRCLGLFWVAVGCIGAWLIEFIRGEREQLEEFSKLKESFQSDAAEPVKAAIARIDSLEKAMTATGKALFMRTKRQSRNVEHHLDNVVECRYLGRGPEVLKQVLDRLEKAEAVCNTFVFFGVPEREFSSVGYSPDLINEVRDEIKGFIKKKRSWIDIVSPEVVNSPTLNWSKFLPELEKEAEELMEAKKKLEAETLRKALEGYRVRRLKGMYPVINFMILRYGDDQEEVIFGWGHHSEDKTNRVFLSGRRQVVETFKSYWNVLEKDSDEFKPHEKPITAPDITGWWFRVSYCVHNDCKARDGIPETANGLHDVALVKIALVENRNIVVSGEKFSIKDSTIIRSSRFRSRAVDLADYRLWFATTSDKKDRLSVAGWYRFVHAEQKNYEVINIPEFYGEFLDFSERHADIPDSESFKRLQVGRLLLFGKRIPSEWIRADANGSDQNEDPVHGREGYLREIPNAPEKQVQIVRRGLEWWESCGKARWSYTERIRAEAPAAWLQIESECIAVSEAAVTPVNEPSR
jgi:hypothetical protein